MPAMNMVQAVNSAMDIMLARDRDVVIFGEDVGYFGGVFRATDGLQRKHGKRRVFDTPIAEGGILGIAVGMGAYGLRPVAEMQFADYIYPAMDQLISEAARLRYRSAGRVVGADHGARAVRRRHLRRPDAQPERRGAVHARLRPEDRDSVQSLRRQGTADQRDRGRRPGRVLRAQAPLQRTVRRPSRRACVAVGKAPAGRSSRRATTAFRSARPRSRGRARTSPCSRTARWCTSRSPRPRRPASTQR